MAIIGPMMSSDVKYTQPYFSGFHIPQFAPVATDPTFSFTPANFPYLVRMSPSDTIQSQALAGIIEQYNWSQFALLVSKDDYGILTSQFTSKSLFAFGFDPGLLLLYISPLSCACYFIFLKAVIISLQVNLFPAANLAT